MTPQEFKNFVFLVEKLRGQQKSYYSTRTGQLAGYHKEVSQELEDKIDAKLEELVKRITNG